MKMTSLMFKEQGLISLALMTLIQNEATSKPLMQELNQEPI